MTKNKTNFFLLVLITLVGLALRFWKLDQFPVSLNWDEISHGYNAYSILTTGKDEWGMSWPLIFRAFGDFKLPVYIYLTVISVFFFGLTAFAVRFISALAGTLAIPAIYLLAGQLFPGAKITVGKKLSFDIGLAAAALLAISPWHFYISRPTLEANLALTLIIYGAYFLFRGLQKPVFFLPASLLLSLSLHTYNTARVFVPLLLVAYIVLYWRQIKVTFITTLSLLVVIFAFGLVVNQVLVGTGTARYQKLAILSESAIFQIGEDRARSRFPSVIARLIHNRPVYFTTTYFKNYFSYFSAPFFNQSHGVQTQFAIPNQNLFGIPVLFLAVIGFLLLIRSFFVGHHRFPILWLLASPAAAAATADPPQALRPNPLIAAIILLSAYGLFRVTKWLATPFLLLFTVLTVILFVGYQRDYYGNYQKAYSASWQYGNREAIEVITNNIDRYDRIIMTKRYGEPHIFYAFYSRLDPKLLMPGPDNIRFMKSDWYWTDKIGRVYFINDWQIGTGVVNTLPLESGGTISTNNSLLITSPDHLPKNTTVIDKIDFLNGDPAFVIAKFN